MTRLFLTILIAAVVLAAAPGRVSAGSADPLLAPVGVCKGDTLTSGHAARRMAVRCLINYARSHSGRARVGYGRRIHHGAVVKARLVQMYGLSHTAGGPVNRTFHLYERRCSSWRIGEVLASGYFSPRAVVAAWLASAEHRPILLGRFHAIGLSVHGGLWVGHFGSCT